MLKKLNENILKICLIFEALLLVICLIRGLEIKVPLICFFIAFIFDKIIEMADNKYE